MNEETEKILSENLFIPREEGFLHTSFDREIAFYESICSGNIELVRIFMKPLCYEGCGTLSEDPLRNLKYHMVVLATMIARYCIKGGMSPEESYSMSDFYIMKTDKSNTEDEIRAVHVEMIEGYTNKMRRIKLNGVFSKQIVHAVNYIMCNINSRIMLSEVAESLKLSPAYFSRLFQRETGETFSEYVNRLKIEEASALLLYTEYSDLEISGLLAYSSQSYFIKIFRRYTGVTPKEYKKKYKIF